MNDVPSKPDYLLSDVGVPCPQCSLKHFRAAFSLLLRSDNTDILTSVRMWDPVSIPVSQAAVALTEWVEGYVYHFDYAYGCLVNAEDIAVAINQSNVAKDIRSARLQLDKFRFGEDQRTISEVVSDVDARLSQYNFPLVGHLAEACREAPKSFGFALPVIRCLMVSSTVPAQIILAFINQLVQFIGHPDDEADKESIQKTKSSSLDTKEGGESIMSCSGKKCAKKLVKAACGGGKVKKACKKGGCKK